LPFSFKALTLLTKDSGITLNSPVNSMKYLVFTLVLAVLLSMGCKQNKPQGEMPGRSQSPHAGLDMERMKSRMENPHEAIIKGGLDLDYMLTNLPDGWTRTEPTSAMRLAQVSLAAAAGDKNPAELAIFHFPGTGGTAAANIERWQNQFTGPKGEPGSQSAKTDTMMVGLLTVITTDVTGTQIASGGMTGSGPAADLPNMRMIASVIETPSGNWFVKAVGASKTMAAHEGKIREFVKRAKVKELDHK